MKTIRQDNRTLRLGRKRPRAHCPRMSLANYLDRASLPSPPPSCDYGSNPEAARVLSDVMLNDELGDCVIAAGYHVVGLETGNAGAAFHASKQQIIADYHAIGGYTPGDPATDQGCDEETALNYWVTKGFANGTKLLGYLAVDATDAHEVRTAMWLFENLFFGLELPDNWLSPMPDAGFVWDLAGAPNPENGHAIIGTGYDEHAVLVDSWGLRGRLTFEAIAAYAVQRSGGQLFVMLTPDQLAKGQQKAPNGLLWSDVITDFNLMGGHVPVPPSPEPEPVPPPSLPPITLVEAEQLVIDSLRKQRTTVNKQQVQRVVLAALQKGWH